MEISTYELLGAVLVSASGVNQLLERGALVDSYPGICWDPKVVEDGSTAWLAYGPKEVVAALKYDLEKKRFADG